MKTIGQILKDARVVKKVSIKKLEEETKIKKSFISDIENEKWDNLPPFATVLGFVKSISGALKLDEKMSVAVLKRDYPPKSLNVNPKQIIEKKSFWNPKVTFAVGISAIILLVGGYLSFQYVRFISGPRLVVDSPKENQEIVGNSVLVFGQTDRDAKVTVNNQPVLVDQDGKFSTDIQISKETGEINIISQSRGGKTTTISRKIRVN